VRLLELACPDAVPLGGAGPAAREAVRLRASTSLAFQAAEVTSVEAPRSENGRYRVTTTVAGLYGAGAPLPAFYSEEILEAEDEESDPVRQFLDVLNHRLLSLLYRAWGKYRWAFTFRSGAQDPISQHMLDLIGLGDPHIRETLRISPQRLLSYAGFLTQHPRNAGTLATVVSEYFDQIPVQVSQCTERWVPIVEDDQNRLGLGNSVLGESFTLGESVQDRMGKFTLELGVFTDLERFSQFLPCGSQCRELGALVTLLVPDPLDYDLRMGLAEEAVPAFKLCSDDADAQQLGWTSWLCADSAFSDKWELFSAPHSEVELGREPRNPKP
jgi:type VI secretion system protein ImpH